MCECVLLSSTTPSFLLHPIAGMQEHLLHLRWEEPLVLDVHICGIPHHLIMLPPMMNMDFYDIDIVVSRSVWWCLVCPL